MVRLSSTRRRFPELDTISLRVNDPGKPPVVIILPVRVYFHALFLISFCHFVMVPFVFINIPGCTFIFNSLWVVHPDA